MNFTQARRSKGWIVLLATVIGLSLGAYSFISNARANHIYTVTCGIIDYKPSVFFQTCADGGIAVGEMEWESWSQDGARGKGTYAINDCLPDCATGKLSKSAVTVVLTGNSPLDEVRGKRVLNQITITTVDKKPLPLHSSNTDSWVLE
ncbi:MAG: hypothetical protein RL475_1035 [Actinomycetota bacterium]|jgi:hypothetical protein